MKNKMIVIDAICGAGKTSWAIQYMNKKSSKEGFDHERFIYVTPYLREIERVIAATKGDFKQPDNRNDGGRKLNGLKKLVADGSNIVCSHELFKLVDNELLEEIRRVGYTLILDEVMNVIEDVVISPKDIRILIDSQAVSVNEDTSVTWNDESYQGKFQDLVNLSKRGNLFLLDECFMFWTFEKKTFMAFEKVFVMTYLFDGQIQKYYYDLHEFEYEKKSVICKNGQYKLVDYDPSLDNRESIAKRLNIYENKGKSKLNSNYCDKPANNMFSATWLRNCDDDTYERLQKNLRTFFVNNGGTTQNSYWTTLKEVAPKLKKDRATFSKDKEKSHNYVSVCIRATNEYKDCVNAAYLFNRYMRPLEKRFFNYHGVEVDEDLLAVSDLVQFLFRGCIRKADSDEVMNVYIPSLRMRTLLKEYLKYNV